MKIAIVGYGAQGVSSLEYWGADPANDITICDANPELEVPEHVGKKLGADWNQGLDEFDLIVRTPIVHPSRLYQYDPEKITSNTNEFFRVCPTRNIIGVTGTKGKGTTSTLIANMLEASGKRVHLGGNIGTPPLDLLKNDIQPDDWVVLELANFQLIDLKYSPYIAACLMVVPEHMDWHSDFAEYQTAKQQLFRWQTADDIAVYYAKNDVSREVVKVSDGKKLPYMDVPGAYIDSGNFMIDGQMVCPVSDMKLNGQHNQQNVCAALTAVWQISQDIEALGSTIREFGGLPYRLELIRELDGVKYYNDSFGTTPETAIVAYEAFDAPKVAIVGGSDKGIPFDDLARTLASSNVRAIIAIGQTGPVIAGLVKKLDETIEIIEEFDSMTGIVSAARKHAQPGDIVLLSTGCASFGMFENYKDRGDQFNQAVRSLA